MSNNHTTPACGSHVSGNQWTAEAQASFDPISWPYYKGYVTSAQVLPGIIFGGLCWLGAVAFVIWLLALCCRSVGWRSRRSRVHHDSEPGRNKWAAYNLLVFVVTLGVIGVGTWALVSGLRSTDGQVGQVWSLVDLASAKLTNLSGVVGSTSTSLTDLDASLTASYTLINDNQAAASAGGIDVPSTLSQLQALEGSVASGQAGTTEAEGNIQNNGILKIEDLKADYRKKTEDANKTYRVIAVAVFFGLIIFFAVITGFLVILDRTPRLSATAALLLLIWTGFVLLFGAGALNVVWRVSRDSCLYGIDYAVAKIGGGGGTNVVLDYYFQRQYIAPQDVSQELFKFNLTSIIESLNDPVIGSLVSSINSTAGQSLISTASASDQAAINALSPRLIALGGNLTALNNGIQASEFTPITFGVQALICCSLTNGLWNLWLASVILGAIAGLLAILAIVKVITAIQPMDKNEHYTPHSPNGHDPTGGFIVSKPHHV